LYHHFRVVADKRIIFNDQYRGHENISAGQPVIAALPAGNTAIGALPSGIRAKTYTHRGKRFRLF